MDNLPALAHLISVVFAVRSCTRPSARRHAGHTHRYDGGAVMARVPVNDKILQRARELFESGMREFHRIISGEVKSVDVEWWREVNGVARHQIVRQLEIKAKRKLDKLDKIRAMTDPARNPNAHERRVAEATLVKLQAMPLPMPTSLPSAPGLEEYDESCA